MHLSGEMIDEIKAMCAAVERAAGAKVSPACSEAIVYAWLRQLETISARLAAGTGRLPV